MTSSFFSDTNPQLIDVKSSRSELQSSLANISSDLNLKTIEKDIGALKGIATRQRDNSYKMSTQFLDSLSDI